MKDLHSPEGFDPAFLRVDRATVGMPQPTWSQKAVSLARPNFVPLSKISIIIDRFFIPV